MYLHHDIMYLLTTTHTWNPLLDTVVLFSLQMTAVIFLSCTAHIRNSCLPSIRTYWKPGASSDLRLPRLPQSLAWVNVVSLWLHTTSLQSVPKILVNVNQSIPLVLTEPFVGGSSFVFVKDEALTSVCRLLWSLLSYQLPFPPHLLHYCRELTRVPAISILLACSSLLWRLTFSPGVLKWKSFLTILYLKLNPFLPYSSGMFYFSPGNLTLSMTMCIFSSYFLYGLTHPTSCKSLKNRASVSCTAQVTICYTNDRAGVCGICQWLQSLICAPGCLVVSELHLRDIIRDWSASRTILSPGSQLGWAYPLRCS